MQLAEVNERLAPLRSGGAKVITPEERQAVEKAFSAAMDQWQKRKNLFKNIWCTALPRSKPCASAVLFIASREFACLQQSTDVCIGSAASRCHSRIIVSGQRRLDHGRWLGTRYHAHFTVLLVLVAQGPSE